MKEAQLLFFKMAAGCLKALGTGFETMAKLIEALTGIKKPQKTEPGTTEPSVKVEEVAESVPSKTDEQPRPCAEPIDDAVEKPAMTVPSPTVQESEAPKKVPPKKRKSSPKPAAKKAEAENEKMTSATGMVLDIIMQSDSGVTAAQLIERTGFENKKIQNIIYKLKRREKIKNPETGLYTKP
jgi:hypothetical protein